MQITHIYKKNHHLHDHVVFEFYEEQSLSSVLFISLKRIYIYILRAITPGFTYFFNIASLTLDIGQVVTLGPPPTER